MVLFQKTYSSIEMRSASFAHEVKAPLELYNSGPIMRFNKFVRIYRGFLRALGFGPHSFHDHLNCWDAGRSLVLDGKGGNTIREIHG